MSNFRCAKSTNNYDFYSRWEKNKFKFQKPKCTRDEAPACHDCKSHILQEIKYTLCTWNVHLPINLYRVLREREEKKRGERMRKKRERKREICVDVLSEKISIIVL